jgi:hypothetical protein
MPMPTPSLDDSVRVKIHVFQPGGAGGGGRRTR